MEIPIEDGLRLRPYTTDDAPALAKIANNRHIADNLRDRFPHPYSLQHARDFIAMIIGRDFQGLVLAMEKHGELVGSIGLHFQQDVHRFDAEIGFFLGEAHWGQGITTQAVRALCEWAFENGELVRIHGEVFESNKASMRVLEKAGFHFEGQLKRAVFKNGGFQDMFVYGRVRPH